MARVQRQLSRFDATSDIGRFHALQAGESMPVQADTRAVLDAASRLQAESGGLFDVTLGTGPHGWRCRDGRLAKRLDGVRLDLGGIAKGYAVDCAVQALIDAGVLSGWVNAGGDLRSFGPAEVSVNLRDEHDGGVRPFARLSEGAFATSCRDDGRSMRARHVSVAAPLCVWADALTKVVGRSGRATHPLLARFEAQAWIH